jgi:hypothetical protein
MNFELTKHAKKVLAEREIPLEWLERTLSAPELSLPDPDDTAVERRYRKIPEFGGRVLRVAVNTAVAVAIQRPSSTWQLCRQPRLSC